MTRTLKLRKPAPRKPETNVELVTRLMEFSPHGALAQAFILEAIHRYAEACAAAGPEALETGLVSGRAWHGCAAHILAELNGRA